MFWCKYCLVKQRQVLIFWRKGQSSSRSYCEDYLRNPCKSWHCHFFIFRRKVFIQKVEEYAEFSGVTYILVPEIQPTPHSHCKIKGVVIFVFVYLGRRAIYNKVLTFPQEVLCFLLASKTSITLCYTQDKGRKPKFFMISCCYLQLHH